MPLKVIDGRSSIISYEEDDGTALALRRSEAPHSSSPAVLEGGIVMRTPNKSHSCLANFSLCTFITVIVVLSALVDTAPAQSAYYAGKTVRIIVGSTAGGGYDVNARTFAPFLTEHLPGKPLVVVQ